jgi:hypothetical protein
LPIKNFKPVPKGKINKDGKKSNFLQGYYKLYFPEKYIGSRELVIYRSSWELKLCKLLDMDPNVVRWGIEIENLKVEYYSPIDDKKHFYYPDFYFEKIINGKLVKTIAEVKAKTFITMPKKPKSLTKDSAKAYNDKLRFYLINQLKYASMKNYCEANKIQFIFLTEDFFKKLK